MDDTARKASGGVRNLRAMFENHDKSEESTPSPQPNRGRSGAPDSCKSTPFHTVDILTAVEYNVLSLRARCGGRALDRQLSYLSCPQLSSVRCALCPGPQAQFLPLDSRISVA